MKRRAGGKVDEGTQPSGCGPTPRDAIQMRKPLVEGRAAVVALV